MTLRLLTHLVVFGLLIALGSGCAAERHVERKAHKRKYKAPCKADVQTDVAGVGSLFVQSASRLYVDQRAFQVCDIVTIMIQERSSAAGSAATDIKRSSDVEARFDALLGILDKLEDISSRTDTTKLVSAATEYTFKGAGKTKREGSLRATVTVYVKRLLPGGNLFVEGSKSILVNDEEQYFYISGVIRQADIQEDNRVSSELLADAQVEFTGKGVVTDAQKQGWLGMYFGWLWPF
jgi:flagellar L-ring protein precursor FlgH